jgi:UrcA family protein
MASKSLSTVRSAVLSLCSATALSLVAGSALAAYEPLQKVVRYSDLDLAKTEDAAALYTRLERAAKSVCRETFAGRDLTSKRMRLACQSEALAAAVAEIDSAALTALHAAEQERVRLALR